jgi:PadR family transcriptional regulator PadR
MWSVCTPRSNEVFTECALIGKNLSRLLQPAILAALKAEAEPLHGYVIVQRIADSPMYGGLKPDAAGVYRTLAQMERDELVTSTWDTSQHGPAKKCYSITGAGELAMTRWVDTLGCYMDAIGELRGMICDSLQVEVPEHHPCCG